MIKKIGLISSIKETYNDQFEFSYDIDDILITQN